MKAWRRFEDWANVVLGAYLFFVPFFVAANAASAWNAYIVGILILCVALYALAQPESKGAEWTNVVLARDVDARSAIRVEFRSVGGGNGDKRLCRWRLRDYLRRDRPLPDGPLGDRDLQRQPLGLRPLVLRTEWRAAAGPPSHLRT